MASRQRSRISPYFKCNRGGPPSADRMYSGERYWRVGAAAATEPGVLLRSAWSETGMRGRGGARSSSRRQQAGGYRQLGCVHRLLSQPDRDLAILLDPASELLVADPPLHL